jgi:hypothetical protein
VFENNDFNPGSISLGLVTDKFTPECLSEYFVIPLPESVKHCTITFFVLIMLSPEGQRSEACDHSSKTVLV